MAGLLSGAVDGRRVINVLTGFLGSGKTSLLRRLLSEHAFARCAVLVNEVGEIALDHELLQRIDQETVVLRSGCICCGVRSDMAAALHELTSRRDRGEIPDFDRVVIETTGLADPVPVINTILSDPALRHHYRVGTVVTTVDALHGLQQLQKQPEARKQAAVADRIVITKADLVQPSHIRALRSALADINAYCQLVESSDDASELDVQMTRDLVGDGRAHEAAQWFAGPGGRAPARADMQNRARPSLFGSGGRPLAPAHGRVRTVALDFDDPLDWTAFGLWLSMLLHRHGESILRVKGILNLLDVDVPIVVHGVQHLLHPPIHLPSWPDDDRRSRLVLIGEVPAEAELRTSLTCFNRMAR